MDECLEVAVEVNSGHVLIKEVVKKDGGYLVYTLIIAAAKCAMSPRKPTDYRQHLHKVTVQDSVLSEALAALCHRQSFLLLRGDGKCYD